MCKNDILLVAIKPFTSQTVIIETLYQCHILNTGSNIGIVIKKTDLPEYLHVLYTAALS